MDSNKSNHENDNVVSEDISGKTGTSRDWITWMSIRMTSGRITDETANRWLTIANADSISLTSDANSILSIVDANSILLTANANSILPTADVDNWLVAQINDTDVVLANDISLFLLYD